MSNFLLRVRGIFAKRKPAAWRIKSSRKKDGENAAHFWAYVQAAGELECWLWLGGVSSSGYGVMKFAGEHQLAHRIAYELTNGEIPAGLTIDHLCRTPLCVNPAHLEAVTIQQNLKRRRWGERKTRLSLDERSKAKVLNLLGVAVAEAGADAGAIPSATVLGMHPQEWQRAVDLLKAGEYVISNAGRAGRTRLVHPDYRTLGLLLAGVERGEVLPGAG